MKQSNFNSSHWKRKIVARNMITSSISPVCLSKGPAWISSSFAGRFKFWREGVHASPEACPSVNKIYQRKRFSKTFVPSSKLRFFPLWPNAYNVSFSLLLHPPLSSSSFFFLLFLPWHIGGMLLDRKYFTSTNTGGYTYIYTRNSPCILSHALAVRFILAVQLRGHVRFCCCVPNSRKLATKGK